MSKPTAAERRYTLWLIENPCFACGIEDDTRVGHHFTFVKRAKSKKAKIDEQLCLCHFCHIEDLHRHGERTFWQKRGYTEEQLLYHGKQFYENYLNKGK